MKYFRKILNPIQIFDLSIEGPTLGLEFFRNVPNFKILVGGGDGTIGWVLMTIDKLKIEPFPPVSIIPLGTGNDLARTLNWGGGYNGEKISNILMDVIQAKETFLDRWSINISLKKEEAYEESKQVFVMNNYFSIGADAKVALEFHRQREANPEKFNSRFGNKMSYGTIGSKALFEKSFQLWKEIKIIVEENNREIPLSHDIEGLIITNLNNYASGIDLWKKKTSKKFKSQSINDGLLEVVTINSPFHLAAIKMGLSSAKRLCQVHEIKIILSNTLPIQVDGEPYEQSPCIIHIKHLNQAKMLYK
jgi:diacylglycerol kinase (ATP)